MWEHSWHEAGAAHGAGGAHGEGKGVLTGQGVLKPFQAPYSRGPVTAYWPAPVEEERGVYIRYLMLKVANRITKNNRISSIWRFGEDVHECSLHILYWSISRNPLVPPYLSFKPPQIVTCSLKHPQPSVPGGNARYLCAPSGSPSILCPLGHPTGGAGPPKALE